MDANLSESIFTKEQLDSQDFIVLNWHGRPIEEFGLYAKAYHCAARRLVSDYGTTGAVRDFEATPILFLYRHAFELYLKSFVLSGNKILYLRGREMMERKKILGTHRLIEFLPCFEAIIFEVGWSWDMGQNGLRKKSDFVDLINEFEIIDPRSFSFRYPTDKIGKGALSRHFSFNLQLFAQRIDPLLEILDGSLSGLEQLLQDMCDPA